MIHGDYWHMTVSGVWFILLVAGWLAGWMTNCMVSLPYVCLVGAIIFCLHVGFGQGVWEMAERHSRLALLCVYHWRAVLVGLDGCYCHCYELHANEPITMLRFPCYCFGQETWQSVFTLYTAP